MAKARVVGPLVYVHQQLGCRLAELMALSEEDRNDLKEYARVEMIANGTEIAGLVGRVTVAG